MRVISDKTEPLNILWAGGTCWIKIKNILVFSMVFREKYRFIIDLLIKNKPAQMRVKLNDHTNS